MAFIESIVELLITILSNDIIRSILWALVVALLALLTGLFVMQFFKFMLPKIWKHHTKVFVVRTLAGLLSFMVAVYLWSEPMGVVSGFLAALAAPWSYRLITSILYRRWPRLERLLSMDDRV